MVLALTALLVAPSVSDAVSSIATQSETQDDSRIVRSVQSRYGLTEAEANQQLQLQLLMNKIDFGALDRDFVAISSKMGRPFVIEYVTTAPSGPNANVRTKMEALGLMEYLQVRIAPVPRSRLVEAHTALRQALDVHSLSGGSTLRPEDGSVAIQTTEEVAPGVKEEITLVAAKIDPRITVAWEIVGSMPIPGGAGGGGDLGNGCTAGFVVTRLATGNRGISTAAHCANDATYWGKALQFIGGQYSDSLDVQWHKSTTIDWDNKIYSDGWRDITWRSAYRTVHVGDWFCKHGITTDTTCGEVTDRDYCASYVPSCDSTFVVVEGGQPVKWCNLGDSGGPVYEYNSAVGLVSGCWTNSNDYRGLFMPEEFMGEIGIRVSTTP